MVGTRIKMAMEKRGLSAAELAELTNLSEETVKRAIEGKAELRLWAVENIAATLGVTKEWLAFGEEAEPVKIRIKYHDDIEHLQKIAIGDWIDLRAAEDVDLKKGDYYYISLGVSMELPAGYEAHVAPRSSTMKQFGILCGNSFGIIDNSFRGDGDVWKFAAYAIRDTSIKKGDRICQFKIEKNQPRLEFIEVEHLGNPDRGGYGSTGRR